MAPASVQDVIGQYEFGKDWSLMLKVAFVSLTAEAIEVAFSSATNMLEKVDVLVGGNQGEERTERNGMRYIH